MKEQTNTISIDVMSDTQISVSMNEKDLNSFVAALYTIKRTGQAVALKSENGKSITFNLIKKQTIS